MFGFNRKPRDVFDVIFGKAAPLARVEFDAEPANDLPRATVQTLAPWRYGINDGEKFPGGFGPTELLLADYWTLRARSVELFERNLYARGLIRRLVANVINTGLHLESTPEETLLGFPEDGLAGWSESTEIRFALWANEPQLCDFSERQTFGALQAEAYQEALIAGDVLVVLLQDQRTKLPRLRLIRGSSIQTPLGVGTFGETKNGTRIVHGVELDANNRQIAYWVRQPDGTSKRLPAWGEKSGRRLAWLVYASDKRLDDVRGKPILSLVLQSLKEIDRYRDNIQRKAVVNSILAMYITKDADKPGTRPMAGNAVRRGREAVVDTTSVERTFRTADLSPGLVIDELQVGERPEAFQLNGTTEAFGVFEEAILRSFAWHFGIPPEILMLSFGKSFSASQAAINELKMHLNPWRVTWGDTFCQPVYTDFLISAVLSRKIDAPGLIDAWSDAAKLDLFAAWTSADWAGQIKPAVDLVKLITAMDKACLAGFMTRARAAREVSGMKFSKVVAELKREQAELAEANAPLAALDKPPPAKGAAPTDNTDNADGGDTGDSADQED